MARRSVPLTIAAALVVGAAADLPNHLVIHGIRLSALIVGLTTGLVVLSILRHRRIPRHVARVVAPMWLFVGFAWLTVVVNGITYEGLQNLVVYVLFAGVVTYSASIRPGDAVTRLMIRFGWLVGGLYAFSLVLGGPDSSLTISRRIFGLSALVYMAVTSPMRPARRSDRWLPWVLFVEIALSLSRTALVVACVFLVVRTSHRGENRAHPVKPVLLSLAGAALLIVAIQKIPMLNDRFVGGDLARVGHFTLNTNGRTQLWSTLVRGVNDSPWVGHGPGASSALLSSEPHNDYLRILYDYGWVGFTLFIWALVRLLRQVVRRVRASRNVAVAAPHTAALCGLVALYATMLTDNTLIYAFVTAPLGVVVGRSLSIRQGRRRRGLQEWTAPRSIAVTDVHRTPVAAD